MMDQSSVTVIQNIGQLVTMAPIVEKKGAIVKEADLGVLRNSWLVLTDGKVREYGTGDVPSHYLHKKEVQTYDAQEQLVLPGFVDSHTHPLFAGKRHHEFAQRLDGATYAEIASAGGGIQATVRATKQASDKELLHLVESRLAEFLRHGVTTVEVKSGYALELNEELRHLEILKLLQEKVPQTVRRTCLALHAIPVDKTEEEFIQEMTEHLLPELVSRSLADYVDVFVEEGYFSGSRVIPFLKASVDAGLGIRLHVDEFTDSGGGALAASFNASSADHLQYCSEQSIAALAKAGTVATLLPGTSLYTGIPYANARKFLDQGCYVSLASDFNPGSCVIDNLPFIASLGALHCGLSAPQALTAITWHAAKSLDLDKSKGALAIGFDADLVFYEFENVNEWVADFGRRRPTQVWCGGEKVV